MSKWFALPGAVLVLAVWFLVAFWGLGAAPFHTKGEPREGLVVWEMTHDGGWILPKRNGTELPSKPPLFHWLGALTSLGQGEVNEWSIRFPSAFLSLLGALMVLAAGTAWWNPRAGVLAALSLMTCFEWARAATNARVDMTLTFGLEAAMLGLIAFWQTRRALFLAPMYLGMAWAVLGKGPVGVALPALTGVLLLLLSFDRDALAQRRWSSVLDFGSLLQLRPVRGALVVLVLAGSWYALALHEGGWAFFRKQILAENLFTYLDDADFGGGHRHGLLYLPAQLLLGLLPWTLLLPAVATALYRHPPGAPRTDARTALLLWIGVVFAFYEFAASKRGVYLLALYPAAALLLGWWWDLQWERIGTQARLARVIAWTCTLLFAVLAVVMVPVVLQDLGLPLSSLVARLEPAWAGALDLGAAILEGAGWRLPLGLAMAMTGLLVGRQSALRVHWSWIFPSLLVSTCVLLGTTRAVVMPAVAGQLTAQRFVEGVLAKVGANDVFFHKTFDYGVVYYSRRHIGTYDGNWPVEGPPFVLVERSLWEKSGRSNESMYQPIEIPTGTARPFPLVLAQRMRD